MRVIVFFDLPVETRQQRRSYSQFRRFLIKNGFLMMQESVYSKLVLNATAAETVRRSVLLERPQEGIVQMMTVTERQYLNIQFVTGEKRSATIDSDERLVVI